MLFQGYEDMEGVAACRAGCSAALTNIDQQTACTHTTETWTTARLQTNRWWPIVADNACRWWRHIPRHCFHLSIGASGLSQPSTSSPTIVRVSDLCHDPWSVGLATLGAAITVVVRAARKDSVAHRMHARHTGALAWHNECNTSLREADERNGT